MGIESQQTSIRASIQEHLNTLRARVYRNTLIATFKNYPGSHMEETHITLFNIANPSQGKVKVGAGGANVRGKTEDDEDSTVEQNAGVGGGAAAGTAFLRAAAAAANEESARLASMTPAQIRAEAARAAAATVGGQPTFGKITPRGQQEETIRKNPEVQAAQQAALNSAENVQRAQNAVWAAQHLQDYQRAPNEQEIARAIKTGAVKAAWDDVAGQHKQLLSNALQTHIKDARVVLTKPESIWADHHAKDVQLRLERYQALSPAERSQQAVTAGAIKGQVTPFREANAAAKADLTAARVELTLLENGLAFMKRKVALAALVKEGLDPSDFVKGEGLAVQGKKYRSGATQEMVTAQKLVVAAKQEAFDKTTSALRDAVKVSAGKTQGEGRAVTEQRRQAALAPNIKAYEAQLTTPNTTYWRQYISPWRQSTAKTAESAGLSFLQDHFRNLETGTSGKKTYRNTTQENLDTLWGMVSRDRVARGSMTEAQQGAARADIIDFIVKTFGAPNNKIETYKELSNFQFFYKVLREINAASAILKSYKNRRSVNNIGNVVKQNMARYFRI